MPIGWGLEVQMKWTKPEMNGDVPGRRSAHTFTCVKGDECSKALMFGGCGYGIPAGPNNDLYELTLDEEKTWKKIPACADGPAARSDHTASLISDSEILVFGGFALKNRLNDGWILNTDTYKWTRAPIEDSPDNKSPSPRGGHAACVVGKKLFISFGYGGLGYGRRDLADMFSLDLETYLWSKLDPSGDPPCARSGHQMSVVDKKVYLSAGWNALGSLNDMFVLDTESDAWSQVEACTFETARWNHCTVAVWAVPDPMLFIFGGNSGNLEETQQGIYQNGVMVLDTGKQEFWSPGCIGDIPEPRASTEIIFDQATHELLVFGGWANEWFGDLRVLQVGEIVGPPYSILSMEPVIGAITGNTEVFIKGLNFASFVGANATVRFACQKGHADATGSVIDEDTVQVTTPDFLKYGAVQVEVRLSIGGNTMTNSSCQFKFHSITDSVGTVAYGPGLLPGGLVESKTCFVIQSMDASGALRDTGGDEFKVVVKHADDHIAHGKKDKAVVTKIAKPEIEDLGNGKYIVSYVPPKIGGYNIDVEFLGTFEGIAGPIRGSTFHADFQEGVPEANNTLEGPLITKYIRDTIKTLDSFCRSTKRGLEKVVEPGDIDELIRVKENLRNVDNQLISNQYSIDTTHAMLHFLRGTTQNKNLDRDIASLEKVKVVWSDVQRIAPETKQAIVPETKAQAANTTKQIEEYEAELNKKVGDFKGLDFWAFENGHAKSHELIAEQLVKVKKEKATMLANANLCALFDFPDLINHCRDQVDYMENNLEYMDTLWNVIEEAQDFYAESKKTLWSEVNAEELEDESKRLMKVTKNCPKDIRWSKAFQGIDKVNKDFLNTVPLIQALHHPSMRLRHWGYLAKATGHDFTPPPEDPTLTVGSLLSLNLHNFTADVEEICDQALKEEKMETQLNALEEFWLNVDWLCDFYPGTEIPLLKMGEEEFEALENDQLVVQGMLASRYIAQFEKTVHTWQHNLAMVAEVFIAVSDIQRTWSYLEPLFIHSDEVKKELPETAERFKGIDQEVRDMLCNLWEAKNCVKGCVKDGLLKSGENIVEQLDVCKKSLADFLDGRRRQFPRYYFTSEADLLDILSNGSNPNKIMVHVPKIYLSTKKFDCEQEEGEERPTVVRFIAGVGMETVTFDPPVRLDGKVEIYMQTVLDSVKHTLYVHTMDCLKRYFEVDRLSWLMHGGKSPTNPAQIHLLISAIVYAREAEECFENIGDGDRDALKGLNEKQVGQLKVLIAQTTTPVTNGQRMRIMTMITLDSHNRDIVSKMIRGGIAESTHFMWQSQLKLQWRKPFQAFLYLDPHLRGPAGERAEVGILNCVLPYDYEYLGNGPRLVVTPLTDRIYVTATQALNLKMGCAPAGPAGTGKTESTKDLANALGKVCYVFNCSPEMDYQSMGNIYKGLASSGAWGCFDEFNRLIPEVLSVCSVQFKAVCDAVAEDAKSCVVEGDEVSLNCTCGAYITMNPGYLGRSELPEGLKALFRPMTVMVPDLVLICENMMMAQGYEEATALASKFYGLYSLLGQLLSKQLHYDWGLRAVKSVLVVAGGFKREEPTANEADLLMRALRDFNIPKIPACDCPIFFGLIGDLFPGSDPPRSVNPVLEEKITQGCAALGYTADPAYHLKCVQLEELLDIRHCVFIMGAAGAFKSAAWRTLQKARELMFNEGLEGCELIKTMAVDVNPKSILTRELYGYITMATREWRDGLLSKVMRDLGNIPDEFPKWIMLDGDLDANWIESMNSVMDDNRMLTLASNERIPLKPHMKLIFEIRDLCHATPATVSRAGVLYISSDEGWQYRCKINSWLIARQESEEVKGWLKGFFDTYIETTVLEFKKFMRPILPVQDISLVMSLLYMLERMLPVVDESIKQKAKAKKAAAEEAEAEDDDDEEGDKPAKVADEEEVPLELVYHTVFVFCTVWSFGCGLTLSDDGTDYQKLFSDWWRSEWKGVKFPSRETVFDYYLDPVSWKLEPWNKSPFFFTVDFDSQATPMSTVTVPTTETSSTAFWLANLVEGMHGVMLAGPAGTGKTQLVLGNLQGQDPLERISAVINFNFYTGSPVLQTSMEVPIVKKTGMNFGPPGQSKLIYFVDDLNLPEVDNYNTQSAISLLRQHIEYGHVVDMGKLMNKYIANCQYVSCMNPTAGSFVVNPRLQRWFTTFAIGMPGPTSLLTIYQTFLDGHLSHQNFPEEVQEISTMLIKAALGLHTQVSQGFRKTAANFHYEFNIRHLSNVFQGLLVAEPKQFPTPEKVVHLWLHESERVYGDRLVSGDDLAKFLKMSEAQSKKNFPQFNVAKFFAAENADPLIFCHFADNIQDKLYDQVTSLDKLSHTLVAALDEYNETNAAMDLVLFEDAMKHVCRIVRIVLNEGGHALLVGVGGSGKQSLSRLAAFICNFVVKQIVISSNYGINDLKEDLKWMYNKAGNKDEGVMFLLTDSQITNERFLIYLNDLLASGNIPDLYAGDELDAIVNNMMPKLKALGKEQNATNAWNFFIGIVRKNLHCSLCFSPVGDAFRVRASKFPALCNCTVIDWFQPWPRNALRDVGSKFLAEIDLGDDATRTGVTEFMPFSFEAVNNAAKEFQNVERRYVYTTPKSYLELLKLYSVLLADKRHITDSSIERLANGLLKLNETGEAVAKIEADLKIALVEAEEKKTVSEGIAEVVAKEKAIVEEKTANAEIEAAACDVIATTVTKKQSDTEADLAKAIPAVEAAMAALNTLNKKDLSECKTMLKPPGGVDDVFAATMVLLAGVHPGVVTKKGGKVKDVSWDAAKKQVLGDIPGYLEALLNFKPKVDAQQVPAINWKEVRPLLALEHFDYDIIKGKNSAAGGLCSWVINIVMYYDIVVTVEPKRKALAEANAQLEAANTKLKAVNELVAELTAKLNKLIAQLNAANAEKQDAMDTVERGHKKLDLAQRLTNALASEKIRWAENVEQLKLDKELLVGDVLLASAFISYIGAFTKPFRDELIDGKFIPFLMKAAGGETIPMTEAITPVSVLCGAAEIASWQGQKLPADVVSTENGAILMNTARWPLMIDPQLQGIAWIREKEGGADRQLAITRLGQKDILRKMEKAVENGLSVLIENLGESIDAVLTPIIQRAKTKKGHKYFVKMGDSEVEFHPNFRLFLHTKLGNPHFPPEIQAECALINFTVTIQGLEDQLLVQVVRKERFDLAEESERLVVEDRGFKIKIKELEDQILFKLASAEGDITEDVELIEGLEEAKRISNDIAEKMAKATIVQANIKVTSEKYRNVAARAALLFFLMNDLVKMHTYYIYSLAAFLKVFFSGIDAVSQEEEAPAEADADAEADPDAAEAEGEEEEAGPVGLNDEELAERCVHLVDSITIITFNYIRRGLFEVDKLTVGTLLTMRVLLKNEKLDPMEVESLLEGRGALEPGNMGPLSEWMPELIWPKVKNLEKLKVFNGLGDMMQADSDDWLAFFDNEHCETAKVPGDFKEISIFHKILLLRALRPDRIASLLTEWIALEMGEKFVQQPALDMSATFKETDSVTPVFFVLFAGVDPTPWVEEIGKAEGFTIENGKFINISMGQGQEGPAEALVERFAKEGGWAMLQNCHLMETWVPVLERLLEVVSETAHEDFRTFISAEPPAFSTWKNMPESLMQSCIKVANQAPSDIKSNLRRCWASFSQERIDVNTKPTEFKGCCFALCWFHAMVLGRMKFGQMGWSRKYSFNMGDLRICSNVLTDYLDNSPTVPWEDLQYIFGEIMYGGHITDAWDRRTCNVYLSVGMHEGLFKGYAFGTTHGKAFTSPDPNLLNYSMYADYLETEMCVEQPLLFGLHNNAEIGYLTTVCDNLFTTIMSMSGGGGGGAGGSSDKVKNTMEFIMERLPPDFEMVGINLASVPVLETEEGPYVQVVLQECTRMNVLLGEVKRSLVELDKGLKGQLNMTAGMEDLATCMGTNFVPGRNPFHGCNWEGKAWFSLKNLEDWVIDLLARATQLSDWTEELVRPFSMWLPGLFNPTAFITAVMQVTARHEGLALDKMSTETHMSRYYDVDTLEGHPPHDGAFVHGIFIEGARWPSLEELDDPSELAGVPIGGHIVDSKLKELLPMLPIIYLRAIAVQPQWEPSSVGYLRHDPHVYEAPMYITTFRGPTYVALSTLDSADDTRKWVLAAVAVIYQCG